MERQGQSRSRKILTALARSFPPSLRKATGLPDMAMTFCKNSAILTPSQDAATETATQFTS